MLEYVAGIKQECLSHGARMHNSAHIIKNIGVAMSIQEHLAGTILEDFARNIQECLPHGASMHICAHIIRE